MSKTDAKPPAVPATLAEQKSDFTAEGSPPPGMVSTAVPVTKPAAAPTVPAARRPRRTGAKVRR